jgi:hypothetical protein
MLPIGTVLLPLCGAAGVVGGVMNGILWGLTLMIQLIDDVLKGGEFVGNQYLYSGMCQRLSSENLQESDFVVYEGDDTNVNIFFIDYF